ncbi:uncharacterized protein LOC141720015 [Apium graveolens]|uniref:uncharacterized protein LOC141720015 n=1 Tax=Apium graveolens TaxID=4045 RepID=UPI003D797C91
MEKLVYALILASRKLLSYFQAHRIEVCTTYPLRQVLHKPESSGRMLKWVVELGQFDLEYMPHAAIKGQALGDFLLEFDFEVDDKALVALHPPHADEVLDEFPHPSLINGLKIALEMRVRNLIAKSDSELVVNQNSNADNLEKMGSQQEAVLLGSIPLEIQKFPSVPEIEVMQVDEAPRETWMTPIIAYIYKETLPEDKFKARRLRYQAARYVVYDEVLYKRRFNQPLLRCIDEEEGNYILREVHDRIYGNHSGGNSLAMKVLRQ